MNNNFTTSLAHDQNRAKAPSVEIRGHLTSLHRWPMNEFNALRRTLGKFGSYGDQIQEQLLRLHGKGLNLPLQGAEDWELIMDAIQEHDEERAVSHPESYRETLRRRPEFISENVCNTYAEQLNRISGGEGQ